VKRQQIERFHEKMFAREYSTDMQNSTQKINNSTTKLVQLHQQSERYRRPSIEMKKLIWMEDSYRYNAVIGQIHTSFDIAKI